MTPSPTRSRQIRGGHAQRPPLLPVTLAAAPALATLFSWNVRFEWWASAATLGLTLLLYQAGVCVVLGSGSGFSPVKLVLALGFGAASTWHLRETLFEPNRPVPFALVAGALAATLLVSSRRWPPEGGRSKGLLTGGVLGVLVATLGLTAIHLWSPYGRWVLLRHVRPFGTALHLLLDEDMRDAWRRIEPEGRAREAAPAPGAPSGAASGERPDVVFLLFDTLRADAIRPNGPFQAHLPTFDALEAEALDFANVYANSSWTKASVASFFTGLSPEEHGARDVNSVLASANVTLAERFAEMGYQTAAFVTNFANVGAAGGFAQGFESFREFRTDPYSKAEIVRQTIERWLPTRDHGRPLFLYVHFLDPHQPYLSGSESLLHYPALAKSAYRAELEYLDYELGLLLESLKRELGSPAFYFLTADHGEEFCDHDYKEHGLTLYREQIHIPVLLLGPELENAQIEAPLEARDFFDLLLGLASGGVSPRDWAASRARAVRFSSLYRTVEASRLRPWVRTAVSRRLDSDDRTLIWSLYGDSVELYDSRSDPRERFNLAHREPRAALELVRRMEAAVPLWFVTEDATLENEQLRQLRALGYIE